MNPNTLRAQKTELIEQAQAVVDAMEDPNFVGDREKEELRADKLIAEATVLGHKADKIEAAEAASIERSEANGTSQRLTGKLGAAGTSRLPANSPQTFSKFKTTDTDDGGFDGFSDFLSSIKRQREGRAFDDRLGYFAAQSVGDLSSGGFLVPDKLMSEVISSMDDSEPWLELVDRYLLPTGYGSGSWPVLADRDESSEDVAGVATKRRSGGSTIVESAFTLERWKLEPASHGTLIRVNNELLEDALPGSVDVAINTLFVRALKQRMALDLVTGDGVGKPVGIVNADSTFEVAKESGQTADTIVSNNILKMRQRARQYSNSVWLANPDTYLQLIDLNVESSNNAGAYWMFRPGNGVDVPDTLLGRPIYFTSACKPLGDKGDVVLGDLSQYQYAQKRVIVDSSTAVAFEQHQTMYKLVARDDGRPKHTSTHKDVRGFETSEFVTLAARES